METNTLFAQKTKMDMPSMNNKELLDRYTVLCMELQAEYLKNPLDFDGQKPLENEYIALRKELLARMGGQGKERSAGAGMPSGR